MPDAPAPAGIGNCKVCAYLEAGTPAICFACARTVIEPLPAMDERCGVCDLRLKDDGTCGNPICNWSEDRRWFGWNYAIAMREGVLERAISRFKYEGKKGWRTIFARVLVGFLDAQPDIFEDFDLIVASPTFIGDRPYDHTREVILAADWEAEGAWPFDDGDPPAIVKSTATPSMAGKTWQQRRQIAEGPLRGALCVPRPARTQGKSILVYDDVFTDGSTLDEVARCLRADGGAQWVCGVTLTRQPWGGAR